MTDPKELYKKILEEHLYDLKVNNITSLNSHFYNGWFSSRLHILELIGFKKEKIDTPIKVIKIIEKYNEEIKAWEQNNKDGDSKK